MQCPRCKRENTDRAHACEHCGAPFAVEPLVIPTVPGSPSMPPDPTLIPRLREMLEAQAAERPALPPVSMPPSAAQPAAAPAPATPAPILPWEGVAPAATAPARSQSPSPARKGKDTLLREPATVESECGGVALVCIPGHPPKAVALRLGRSTIGRGPDNDIVLDDPKVSGQHAVIRIDAERVWLLDVSSNGTEVDGTRVYNDRHELRDGAVLRLGDSALALWVLPPAIRGLTRTGPA